MWAKTAKTAKMAKRFFGRLGTKQDKTGYCGSVVRLSSARPLSGRFAERRSEFRLSYQRAARRC